MLSLIGPDQLGIVARLSAGLCKSGCNLGDSSMVRLGKYFTIMLMIEYEGSKDELETIAAAICEPLKLNAYLVELGDKTQHHREPDVRISLFAEDRVGIVEDTTTPLAQAGLNILHLESNVEEAGESGTYHIHLEGTVSDGLAPLYKILEKLEKEKGIQSHLIPINAQVT